MLEQLALRTATADDAHLPSYDFTKLSAVNSCPRYGILRYTQHKTLTGGGRAMALEAGTALHQCFAAIRLWQLGFVQDHQDLMNHHGRRLFGDDRWSRIGPAMHAAYDADDASGSLRAAALECLSTTGFVDDDSDKRRTYSNLETALLYYCQRWDHARYPVWVRDPSHPQSDVGIELAFDMVAQVADMPLFRYTGRVDGIHVDKGGELVIQENKTASRLNTAWRMAFNTSHQVTGYCVAASLFTRQDVGRAIVLGLALPLPRTLSEGLAMEYVRRDEHSVQQWLAWLLHTVNLHDKYARQPLEAPMYTHSCNRYFQPCQFIPLCAADADEQQVIVDEMSTQEWSPLLEAH